MTSRRAQRRARDRATAATALAPGTELERWEPAEVASSFAELERQVVDELERGTASGDLRAYTAAYRRFISHPAAASTVGMGYLAANHARRASWSGEIRPGRPLGCGMPKSCFEEALAFVLANPDAPRMTLIHGLVVEHGYPWCHAWAEFGEGRGILFDPTTGEFFERDSFYELLNAAAVTTYTPEEAAANLARTGRAKQWSAFMAAHAQLVDSWIRRLRRQHPGLIHWLERMLEVDPGFRARYDQLAELDDLLVVGVLEHLARTGRWRDHEPGVRPWPAGTCTRSGGYGEAT